MVVSGFSRTSPLTHPRAPLCTRIFVESLFHHAMRCADAVATAYRTVPSVTNPYLRELYHYTIAPRAFTHSPAIANPNVLVLVTRTPAHSGNGLALLTASAASRT